MNPNPYLRPLGILLPTNNLTAAEREEFRKQWYALHTGPGEPAKVLTADAIERMRDRLEAKHG